MRLGDVARVIDDVENNRVAAWTDGERAVLLIIRRQPGANILETIDRVKALLPALARVDLAGDRRRSWRSTARRPSAPRCTTSSSRLLLSVALVVLVVFVFLRSAARDR